MMRVLKYLFVLAIFGGLASAAGVAGLVWHFSKGLPSTEGLRDIRLQVPLRIYSADDALIGEYGAERREPIRYENIPPDLIHAFLAAEDDRFFEHPGVDYQGLLRAVWMLALTGEKAQGGSTITMQLARNFFLSSEKSYIRKIREILLALDMERQLSKTEILSFYLNKIYLGHRAYGIGAAAKVYYGVELKELTLAQMAMMAGLPKAPSRYNPVSGPQRALLRRNYVLRRMRELDYITDAQLVAARDEPISAQLRRGVIDLEANYVAEYARARIISQYGTDAYTTGLIVHTTIEANKQRAGTRALRDNLLDYDRRHEYRGPEAQFGELNSNFAAMDAEQMHSLLGPLLEEFDEVGGLLPAFVVSQAQGQLSVYARDSGLVTLALDKQPWPKLEKVLKQGDLVRLRALPEQQWQLAQVPTVQGAFVEVDPTTGAVRAMNGGFDYFASKFNRAMQAQRQPGSAFKPFVYSAALENGFTPASIINDAPVVFEDAALGGAWRPENYSGRFYGPTPLREALFKSSNLVAIRVLDTMGIQTARNYVTQFGFDLERLPRNLSMVLGTGVFSPLEMAQAYAVLANGGYAVKSYLIERVTSAEGKVLHQASPAVVCEGVCLTRRAATLRDREAFVAMLDSHQAGVDESQLPPEPLPVAPRVISAANAYLMTDMMMDVIQQGTGVKAKSLGRDDLAGKTGTTNDQRDAWFCGFNAAHVAVAWVGFDDISPLGHKETGGRAALPIWMDYMRETLKGVPSQRLPQPSGVVSARINPQTGLRASFGSANAKFELFMAEHLPAEESSFGGSGASGVYGEPQTRATEEELIEDIF